MTQQYLRQIKLIAYSKDTAQPALDLSEMHIKYLVKQNDVQSPNNAVIRVYNLAQQTVNTLVSRNAESKTAEFSRILLQAGYVGGNFGTIFNGDIKQFMKGRENATDTYLDFLAADGDLPYNFAVVNTTLAEGATPQDVVNACLTAMQQSATAAGVTPITLGYVGGLDGQPALPRGKVLYGMARDILRDVCHTTNTSWSIQNGQLQIMPLESYVPGTAVVLTQETGLIGQPSQTIDGIIVKALLNPQFAVGGRVQINNALINQNLNAAGGDLIDPFTSFKALPQKIARVADDGFYRILVAEHSGDTRGVPWYTDLVCIALDDTVPVSQAAKGRV